MELLRYCKCIDGNPKSDLYAVIKRWDRKRCERISEDHRRRESEKIENKEKEGCSLFLLFACLKNRTISLLLDDKMDYDMIKNLIEKEENTPSKEE